MITSEVMAATQGGRKEEHEFNETNGFCGPCICCGAESKYSILLASDDGEIPRYYIPNQAVRAVTGTTFDCVKAVPFCHACIREVEDSMRETISRLQRESA